jgi:hypothetical protein
MKLPKTDKLCKMCGQRPAKSMRNGKVAFRPQHDICMQCFRSQADSNFAMRRKVATRA